MDDSQTDETEAQLSNSKIGRRTFCVGAAGTIALAGTGLASAQSGTTINYSSEYAQDPYLTGVVEVSEHDGSEMSELEYINDEGEIESLSSSGVVLADRPNEDDPYNPVAFSASSMTSDELVAFPRGVTRDTGDDEEEDVSALDAQEWSGDLTIDDDGDALSVSGTGSSTFSNFEIDSGEVRKHLQMVLDVDSLPADADAAVRVVDSNGDSVETVVDSDADSADDNVIATETASGVVFQRQLGELVSDLETLTEIEIEITGSGLELTINGLNLERETRWELGERETLNEDDEIETETVRQSTGGPIEITSLDTLTSPFASATIEDVEYQIEQRASELPASATMVSVEDAGRIADGERDQRVEIIHQFETPAGYALSWTVDSLVDETRHPSNRYRTAEFAAGIEEIEEWDDVDDINWTDRTSEYGGGEIGDELELTSLVSSDDRSAVRFDLILTGDEADDITAPVGGGAAALQGGGGFWSSARGIVLAMFTGVAGYFALIRNRVTGGA